MEDGMNRGWQRGVSFTGMFSGYTVQGVKYRSDNNEVGWYIKSWPMRDPIHDFWISGTTFYRVKVYPAGEVSSRQRVELYEIIDNLEARETSSVLEAIEAWEKELLAVAKAELP